MIEKIDTDKAAKRLLELLGKSNTAEYCLVPEIPTTVCFMLDQYHYTRIYLN